MSIQDIIQGLDYLSQSANKSAIMMNNMIVLIGELLIVFVVRSIMLFKINSIPVFKTPDSQIKQKTIIRNHLGFEISIALVISWLIMMVISSVELNYVVNLIISPIVGTLTGITVDNMYILPRQNRSLYNTANIDQRISEKTEHTIESPINITINKDSSEDHIKYHNPDIVFLPESLANSSDFNKVIIDSINQLSHIILDLRESEMIERKMYLKSEMYRCLSNGFATPGEHDKIRNNYYAYTELLKGNGDVKNLYENHFEHLGVHEDRRKRNGDYQGPERRINHNCEYGEFDNETLEQHESNTLNNCE